MYIVYSKHIHMYYDIYQLLGLCSRANSSLQGVNLLLPIKLFAQKSEIVLATRNSTSSATSLAVYTGSNMYTYI